jgi:hypothetical protein
MTIKSPQSVFEPLDKNIHNRMDFDCGVLVLNHFLQTKASKEMKQNLNTTYVLTTDESGTLKPIFGYYTLSASSLVLSSVPPNAAKHVPPNYQLPTARIGRLARDKNYPGTGQLLLKDALTRITKTSAAIGIYGVEVDAKDNAAKSFYEKFGFISLIDNQYSLFLPMKTILQAFT